MARILIAEDSPVNQSVYAYILKNGQHEVLLANNGRIAWEQFQNDKVDLVISDISMPEMDGPTFIRHVRQSALGASVPCVMLTGIGVDLEELQDLCVDADAVLTKPTSSWELIETVNHLLGSRS